MTKAKLTSENIFDAALIASTQSIETLEKTLEENFYARRIDGYRVFVLDTSEVLLFLTTVKEMSKGEHFYFQPSYVHTENANNYIKKYMSLYEFKSDIIGFCVRFKHTDCQIEEPNSIEYTVRVQKFDDEITELKKVTAFSRMTYNQLEGAYDIMPVYEGSKQYFHSYINL